MKVLYSLKVLSTSDGKSTSNVAVLFSFCIANLVDVKKKNCSVSREMRIEYTVQDGQIFLDLV